MKRSVLVFLTLAVTFLLLSCTTANDFYGTWYVDEGNTRNVIQFSENAAGKDVFVWIVYDIKNDSIKSNNTGYYKVSGDVLIFEGDGENNKFELAFQVEGDTLILSSESASLTLEKYTLD